MPRRDGTGPQGKGPMTGLKMGRCAGVNEGSSDLIRRDRQGNGVRRGLGKGRFMRNVYRNRK